jgi:hypothetical protein
MINSINSTKFNYCPQFFEKDIFTTLNIIQLITFDEVNTRIDQPVEHDIHRGI